MNKRGRSSKTDALSSQDTGDIFYECTTFYTKADIKSVLKVQIYKRMMANSFETVYPTISIGKILEEDSPIFEVVSSGDLENSRSLLEERKVTLRDRDPMGRPFLHVGNPPFGYGSESLRVTVRSLLQPATYVQVSYRAWC